MLNDYTVANVPIKTELRTEYKEKTQGSHHCLVSI